MIYFFIYYIIFVMVGEFVFVFFVVVSVFVVVNVFVGFVGSIKNFFGCQVIFCIIFSGIIFVIWFNVFYFIFLIYFFVFFFIESYFCCSNVFVKNVKNRCFSNSVVIVEKVGWEVVKNVECEVYGESNEGVVKKGKNGCVFCNRNQIVFDGV